MTELPDEQSKNKNSNVFDLKQIADHLQTKDPNETILFQAPDGTARLFVNSDELPNYYSDGKSFEDLGIENAKKIGFELMFRLHRDSVMAISRVGETLAPAVPVVTYHGHVWWFWTYELGVKDVDGGNLFE